TGTSRLSAAHARGTSGTSASRTSAAAKPTRQGPLRASGQAKTNRRGRQKRRVAGCARLMPVGACAFVPGGGTPHPLPRGPSPAPGAFVSNARRSRRFAPGTATPAGSARDDDAQDRDEDEDDGGHDRELKDRLLDAAARPVDGRVGRERAAEGGA